MINYILLILLLLVSMVLLKCTNSPLVIHFLNFVRLFRLQVLFQIKNANLPKTFLVSCNVTSLFTNIPLRENIEIAINLIFNHNLNLKITRKELKKIFLFDTLQNHFVFNRKFYNQIDGVAMSSPLAPVLANILMGFHEPKWFN